MNPNARTHALMTRPRTSLTPRAALDTAAPRSRNIAWAVAGLAILTAWVPRPAAAQTLAGLVLEAGTDRAVPFSELTVLDTLGNTVASGFADGGGAFSIKLQYGGSYQIYAQRLGYYAAVSPTLELKYRETLELAIRLQPKPFESDSLTVEVSSQLPSLDRVGFYDRQRSGIGTFYSRLEIVGMIGLRSVADVVREAPGVRIVSDNFGKDRVTLRNTVGGQCIPMLILDGIAVNPPWEDMLEVDDLDGVEVYPRPAQVPSRFQALVPMRDPRSSNAAQCGLLVAWTRTGSLRR